MHGLGHPVARSGGIKAGVGTRARLGRVGSGVGDWVGVGPVGLCRVSGAVQETVPSVSRPGRSD